MGKNLSGKWNRVLPRQFFDQIFFQFFQFDQISNNFSKSQNHQNQSSQQF